LRPVFHVLQACDGPLKEFLLIERRKVFLGKNLYSKGACYAGYIKDGNEKWPYTYIGDNELKLNVSLKVLSSSHMEFVNLISAGESW
jgi:hypothetical protein